MKTIESISNQEVMHLLNQKKRLLEKEINYAIKKHHLYTSQWAILYCLNRFGSMSQTDIWKYLNVEAPTVTRTLARMEKSGWIVRRPGEDKRERIIQLTKVAQQNFPEILSTVDEVENDLLGNLTDEEKQQLYDLLSKIE